MPTTEQQRAETDIFVDLALSDDELVRAEFDALIAACWESPCEPPLGKAGPPAGGWVRPQPWWPRPPQLRRIRRGPVRRPGGRGRGPPRLCSRIRI
ncbi:hypothetical protein [Kribbella jejuensis]|uniref:hypothetical protein n=1 Tax=Kribbella jejuensis TaxID=236068 RepID=UPI001152ED70|nr:hypothetical protein [Kribbella jejuensis]